MVMVEMVGLDGLLFLKSSFETILPSPSWLQKTDATRKDDTQHTCWLTTRQVHTTSHTIFKHGTIKIHKMNLT